MPTGRDESGNSNGAWQRYVGADGDPLEEILRDRWDLWKTHVKSTVGPALSRVDGPDDILQEAMERLVRHGQSVRLDRHPNIDALFRRLVSHAISDRCRYHDRDRRQENDESFFDLSRLAAARTPQSPYQRAVTNEDLVRLSCALDLLSTEDRELLLDCHETGADRREIALRMEITRDTLNKRVTRALRKLTRHFVRLRHGQIDSAL